MRKIKVLHLITRLIAGGAQGTVLSIVSGLDKNRFDVTFACGPQGFNPEMAHKWNVDAIIIPDLIREIHPIKDLKALARLYFFIKKNNFDIVHTYTSKAGMLGRIAAKLAGAPIIFYSPRGSIYHPIYYGAKALFFLSRLENFAATFTDKIITCSESERRDFLKYRIGADDKYITIYSGLKEDIFLETYDSVSKRIELGIPKDAVLIGNIARLTPEKGHIFCLEAFRIFADRFPQARLLLAGDGILKKDIEVKINELNLNDRVITAGYRKDIPEILSALDISLHTSIWEGLPRTVIEAMLAGKPIVATKAGGIPELIEDGKSGILIPPCDKEALVEAIVRLINDKGFAKRIGEAARRRAKEKFTLEMMVENITKLYNNFIELKIINKN